MARLTSDLRFALRQIMRSPGFAITAIVTLALAIGANTAIFTLLNQALLRALPVKDPSQLVVLSFSGDAEGHKESQGGDSPGHNHYFSYPMYRDLRDHNKVFSGLIAAAPASAGVSWNNHAEQSRLNWSAATTSRRSECRLQRAGSFSPVTKPARMPTRSLSSPSITGKAISRKHPLPARHCSSMATRSASLESRRPASTASSGAVVPISTCRSPCSR
jgi:hypothetical protein